MVTIEGNLGFLGVGMNKVQALSRFDAAKELATKLNEMLIANPSAGGEKRAEILQEIVDFNILHDKVRGFSSGVTMWGKYATKADNAGARFVGWLAFIAGGQPPSDPIDWTWPIVGVAAALGLWLALRKG